MKGKSRISINDWSVASAYTGCWRQFWPSKFLKLVPKPYILKEIRIHCCFLFCFWKPIHRRTLIWGHRFPPNNKRMNSTLLQWDLSSFVIWRKSTTPKKHFEIKWPLAISKKNLRVKIDYRILCKILGGAIQTLAHCKKSQKQDLLCTFSKVKNSNS